MRGSEGVGTEIVCKMKNIVGKYGELLAIMAKSYSSKEDVNMSSIKPFTVVHDL